MCDDLRQLVLVTKNRCNALKPLHPACVGLQCHAICTELTLDNSRAHLGLKFFCECYTSDCTQKKFQENHIEYTKVQISFPPSCSDWTIAQVYIIRGAQSNICKTMS